MMRSVFILFLMLQWTRSSYGYEDSREQLFEGMEKYVDVDIDNSDDSSVEELTMPTTTRSFETVTETIPPIKTPEASTLEDLATSLNPFLNKFVSSETTEAAVELVTEVPAVTSESAQSENLMERTETIKKSAMKSIKPRLLESPTDEIIIKSEHKDDETLDSLLEEDTTPIAEIDSDLNETSIDLAEEETTIQPPTSKKPKKIEIYKTRPNELLRHYVEDSHLRSPVAALIDKKTNPLAKAKKLWKTALKPNALLDIMVVSYDSEGKLRDLSPVP